MSWRISGIVNFGWLPWTTAKTVYPRPTSGSMNGRAIASCAENQPPLTTRMTPSPLASFSGVKTSIVSAVPDLRP